MKELVIGFQQLSRQLNFFLLGRGIPGSKFRLQIVFSTSETWVSNLPGDKTSDKITATIVSSGLNLIGKL